VEVHRDGILETVQQDCHLHAGVASKNGTVESPLTKFKDHAARATKGDRVSGVDIS
jgi:hypothetical protein